MTSEATFNPDPAGVFACATSLWEACLKAADTDDEVDLSAAYSGMDQLMREVMRIGEMFEDWACEHVDFDALDEVWPYLLEERFGMVCLKDIDPDALASFNAEDCLRVAIRLNLAIRLNSKLPVPVDLSGKNPVEGAGFRAFRIQSVRTSENDEMIAPFTKADDPYDPEFGSPFFGIYGVYDGELEHITDRGSLAEAIAFVRKLAPGVSFDDPK